MRPDAITLPPMPSHPYLKKPVATFLNQAPESWVDDEAMPYFNEGANNFKYDDKLVVEEVPLFVLSKRDAAGTPAPIGAPHVIGTGPLLARRPPDAPGGRPRFGSFTRFHFAMLGATAAAFDPDMYPDAVAALVAKMLDPEAYRGRVASNAHQGRRDRSPLLHDAGLPHQLPLAGLAGAPSRTRWASSTSSGPR